MKRPSVSTIISLGAFCVACLAYWNTIVTQQEDREFRELSIRPSLSRIPEATDFSVRIKNIGQGPAVIKRIAGFGAGQCVELDSKNKQEETWKFQREHLIPFVVDRLQFAWSLAGINVDYIRTRFQMPAPGTQIQKDDEFMLFAFDEEDTATLKKLVRDHRAEGKMSTEFLWISRAIPIAIEYCSLTGKYCYNEDSKQRCLRRT